MKTTVVLMLLAVVLISTSAFAAWEVICLHPSGSSDSVAHGVSAGQQAGFSGGHAGFWAGSAGSWVDLNPAGSTESTAWDVSNGQQAGFATLNGVSHAGLWSGTAASWADLNLSLIHI